MVPADSNRQGLDRITAVLRVFGPGRGQLKVADVAALTGMGMSTTSRLLAAMEAQRLLERDPNSGLYQLGLELAEFAAGALNLHPVHRAGRMPAQRLAAELGASVNLAIRRGGQVFYLANFEGGAGAVGGGMTLIGRVNPLHATALGKTLLLDSTRPDREELLGPEPFDHYTPATVATHDQLDEQLAAGASNGYVVERQEMQPGRSCLAAPLRDAGGRVVGAVSIAMQLSRLDSDETSLATALLGTTHEISGVLGYVGPAVATRP